MDPLGILISRVRQPDPQQPKAGPGRPRIRVATIACPVLSRAVGSSAPVEGKEEVWGWE